MKDFALSIANKIALKSWQVENTLQLLEQDSTIPFIARYRKEKTGGLTEVEILEISKISKQLQQLEDRKEAVLKILTEQGVLNDDLKQQIQAAEKMGDVEDIYLPYKPKRKTRASIAREKGLEPLAKMIMSENLTQPEHTAKQFINKEKGIETIDHAIEGAMDIMAEWVNERIQVRKALRRMFHLEAVIKSVAVKDKEDEGQKYAAYFDWEEKANRAPSHRILAMFRGEEEKMLKVSVLPDISSAIAIVEKMVVKGSNPSVAIKKKAIADAVKRLLFPSLENDYRSRLKEDADESAIKIFSDNLQQLLLAPPLGQKRILAIDPGFRTGCKIVCLDEKGDLLHNDTIYPHPPQRQKTIAIKKIKSLVNAYQIQAIAIGNGTAGRETEEMIRHIRFDRDLLAIMVNESGASVYSASDVARREFPDYDVTVRGAISIGRRLMDPLAELVKIDPKAIGVGQYQHDVNQLRLKENLSVTVELCVNKVGVDLNTASSSLLSYVSGLGQKLADRIVAYRSDKGRINGREELMSIKGFGDKAFQQSAGFLRIKDGPQPLDASAVHPEHYHIVQQFANDLGLPLKALIGKKDLRDQLNLQEYTNEEIGEPTINDILSELEKPGRDPRIGIKQFEFDKHIRRIEDLKSGMILPAIATNITSFGVFVDIGIHESGLIHKSQIAKEFVKDPAEHIKLNQQLKVRVIEVDVNRKRIALSLIHVDQHK